MPRESSVEKRVATGAKEHGGQSIKLTGYRGVPDRLLLMPRGQAGFVETKAPSGIVSTAQGIWHRGLIRLGFDVWIPRTPAEVDAIFDIIRCRTP